MSSDLAIAGVSAVLRNRLHLGMVDHATLSSVAPVMVTAEAPDLIKLDTTDLADRINLFMYHVTPNAAWRNWNQPSRDGGGNRIANVPLAIDLYYLVTAYSQKELFADVLLGYAMQYLHELGVLARQDIIDALSTPPAEVPLLTADDLISQVEQIRIVPYVMDTEEMSKLWMAFQARYRPSAAYHVSVLLIDNMRPSRSGLPVLTIGRRDPVTNQPMGVMANASLAPARPTLTAAVPPASQDSVRVGETLALTGFHLADGPALANFTQIATGAVLPLPGTGATSTSLNVTIPAAAPGWRAGIYSVSATIGAGADAMVTNSVPVVLVPSVGVMTKSVTGTTITLTITCHPPVYKDQSASCLIADQEFIPAPLTADPSDTLVFVFDASTIAGKKPWLRLRVDGVDSILIDKTTTPPSFIASQQMP